MRSKLFFHTNGTAIRPPRASTTEQIDDHRQRASRLDVAWRERMPIMRTIETEETAAESQSHSVESCILKMMRTQRREEQSEVLARIDRQSVSTALQQPESPKHDTNAEQANSGDGLSQ